MRLTLDQGLIIIVTPAYYRKYCFSKGQVMKAPARIYGAAVFLCLFRLPPPCSLPSCSLPPRLRPRTHLNSTRRSRTAAPASASRSSWGACGPEAAASRPAAKRPAPRSKPASRARWRRHGRRPTCSILPRFRRRSRRRRPRTLRRSPVWHRLVSLHHRARSPISPRFWTSRSPMRQGSWSLPRRPMHKRRPA